MARAFAKISFTPSVQQIQAEMGSQQQYQTTLEGDIETVYLSDFEKQFIQARDSFYQATVGENGWPYVQHRGGPVGFLKVLDAQTIGFADFSGNRQYISTGNLSHDSRISLILMDYPAQQRLKIWGRVRIIDEAQEPEMIAKLESPDFRAPVERGFMIHVEAFDWNCPKYITPRFNQDEIKQLQLLHQAEETGAQSEEATIGKGSIQLVITAIEQQAKMIRSYTLQAVDHKPLPSFTAGAHIKVPVRLSDGTQTTRAYSLTSVQQNQYQIAVKKDEKGQGASVAIHEQWQVGNRLNIEAPENYFALHHDKRSAVLIAGGIGITPIKAMTESLKQSNTPFALHYTGKSIEEMAFVQYLTAQYADNCQVYASQQSLPLENIMQQAPEESVFYICGPQRLINAARQAIIKLGIGKDRLNYESFS